MNPPAAPAFTFVDDAHGLDTLASELGRHDRFAVDLEADSLHSYRDKVCLLQFSTADRHWLLDPLAVPGWPERIGPLLLDPTIRKILHGADYDVRLLKKRHGLSIRNLFDTGIVAQLTGRTRFGLAALLEEAFGVVLDKRFQRANWAARPLGSELLAYAACDTVYLLDLADGLAGELEQLDRTKWAEEEFALLQAVDPAPDAGANCFRVKGAGRMPPEQLVVLQELLEVRDIYASRWDRPPFKVLANPILLSWATTPPRSRREITSTRGVPRRFPENLLDDLEAAFERAVTRSPSTLPWPDTHPRPPMTPAEESRLKRLKRARMGAAERLGLAPGLLVNSHTLEGLARCPPPEAPAWIEAHLKRWQREAVGPDLETVLVTP